ncbi:MAG: GNAT family N-acetyltransferase [Chloroflexi bacterium]|nr:GNAT family N-acetyltransferase [Chloroflexota bacterium]
MENISIREVEAKDAEFLFNLMNDESILKLLNEVATSLESWGRSITEWSNDADEEEYIILDNNIPVGWLGVNGLISQNRQAWIKLIALTPNKQGLEIGPYIINQLIENLKLRGYESIALYTDRSNVNAQKCYQKCGFAITDTFVRKMNNGKYVERYKMEVGLI